MNRIKKAVSLSLDIAAEQLNEISLEDVEIERISQDQIYKVLLEMAFGEETERNMGDPGDSPRGIPCTGFWVEETRELILFAWSRDMTKTIVVPPGEWFLRGDITLN